MRSLHSPAGALPTAPISCGQIFPVAVVSRTVCCFAPPLIRRLIIANINNAAAPGTIRPMRRDPVPLEIVPVNQESTAPPSPAEANTQPALRDPPISVRKRARMRGNTGARARPVRADPARMVVGLRAASSNATPAMVATTAAR